MTCGKLLLVGWLEPDMLLKMLSGANPPLYISNSAVGRVPFLNPTVRAAGWVWRKRMLII